MTDPFSALLAAIPGLAKAGADIASASDEAKRNAQLVQFGNIIIQLQTSIMAVQNQNSSLLRDKDELEKQLVAMKNWEVEKQRYTLTAIWDGAMAYALKESMRGGEPAHWLCTNCFRDGKKSILNETVNAKNFHSASCPVCKSSLQTSYYDLPKPKYANG